DDPHGQQGVLGLDLDGHEGGQKHHGDAQEAQGGRGRPSVRGGLGEPVDQGHQAGGDGDSSGNVVAGVALGLGLPHHRNGGQRGHGGDGHVHQQAPAPRGVLGEYASHDESDGRTAAGDGSVDAEGGGALLHLGEG